MGLGRLKERGARDRPWRVNPVRTGYNAIADEWVGITPGTDGLFVLALVHELIRAGKVDMEYLVRYTNAALPGERRDLASGEFGMFRPRRIRQAAGAGTGSTRKIAVPFDEPRR